MESVLRMEQQSTADKWLSGECTDYRRVTEVEIHYTKDAIGLQRGIKTWLHSRESEVGFSLIAE
jgi:hypothetical protein